MPFVYASLLRFNGTADDCSLTQTKIYCLGMLITLNLRAVPSQAGDGVNVSYSSDSTAKPVSSKSVDYVSSTRSRPNGADSSRVKPHDDLVGS
jgi:hypothetical protein